MKNLKAFALMALAILAGLGAAVFAASWVAQRGNIASTKVVVAAMDIELGSKINPQMLTSVDWPTGSIPQGATHEEAWLVRVLINICRDRWRQNAVRTRARLNGNVRAEPAYNPEPHLIAQSLVRQALESLPPRRRAILLMYEVEGTPIPSIAKLLGISAVTVRWHLSIGRREMAKSLGKGSHD